MLVLARDLAFAVFAILMLACVIFILGNGGVRIHKPSPEPSLARDWERVLWAERSHNAFRIEVVNVYRRRKAGAKAWVRHNDGRIQEAWFNGDARPLIGDTYVLSRAKAGLSMYSGGRTNVMYIEKECIIARARAGARREWTRAQQTRQEL